MIVVIFGPGGVGKGTLADRLVAQDPRLWLSRSWTTRPRRRGERSDAYRFVSRDEFEAHRDRDGFLEWNELAANGHLYGTPLADAPVGRDVVYEIDVNGLRQVQAKHPEALAILIVPPSMAELERRLRRRGDDEEQIARRLELAEREVREGRELADQVVVNDDLTRSVEEVARIVDGHRSRT